MSRFVAASFAGVSASSFPRIPTCVLTQQKWISRSVCSNSVAFRLIFSMRYVYMLLFWSESRVVWLPVYMMTALSVVCMFSMYSSDFSIASCSAWLFVHFLFNLYFKLLVWVPDLYTAMPAPTPILTCYHR